MPSIFTRHGTSRAGDDYQDLWGAQILVEFLEHPDRYQWVRFEASEFGTLDDIVALRTDGKYVARQIKFTVDPEREEYEVSWDWLLDPPQGTRRLGTSLLQKWMTSLVPLVKSGHVYEAALFTNRRASAEIASVMEGDRIDFDAITDTEIRDKIITQLGSEETARTFFGEFRFKVDCPGPETLEESLKSRFFILHGDPHGWLNLMDEIRRWAIRKDLPPPSGQITMQALRRAALWHQLHELPQGFEIPQDYVVPSEEFHKWFLDSIRNRRSPCLVLSGSPGVGKSTYLSYLVNCLKEENIPVIRHHYFLSMSDRSGDRFSYQRIAESLMQQIQARYPGALGAEGIHNPDHEQLGAWLQPCSEHYASQGVPFVVIVDGLDHVWRERQSNTEVTLLFERLLPTPSNVVLIIGTQSVAVEQLPPRLPVHAPRNEWVHVPPMSVGTIRKWLELRSDVLDVPAHEDHREHYLGEISSAFYKISRGHPLHLRYSFQTLIERGERIWEYAILDLPPCPGGEIERYYQRLYGSLPDSGRQMLHLLAACDFPWPKQGLLDCLSPDPGSDAEVMTAERQIAHLLRRNALGATAFHGSLLVFLRNQTDHEPYKRRLLPKVIDWLVNSAPEYWRWAYEWVIRAEAGDASALRDEPSQEWAVVALATGRPLDRILDILQRAAWIALDEGKLPRVIELGTLAQYVENGPRFQTDEFERLLFCQLALREDPILERRVIADLPMFADDALPVVAEAWARSGDTTVPQRCFEQFRSRLMDARDSGAGRDHRLETDVKRYLNLRASISTVSATRVLEFIRANRNRDGGFDAFKYYSHVD